jgi:phosphoglycolate phosphatase-like HAD superfamily hydrolase
VLDRARPGLSRRLTGVFGRSRDTVADLKPAPDLVLRALASAGVDPPGAVFVGDSVTDVLAGTAAGVPVVGLHEAADRRAELAAAGAVAVVADIADLLDESREPGSR